MISVDRAVDVVLTPQPDAAGACLELVTSRTQPRNRGNLPGVGVGGRTACSGLDVCVLGEGPGGVQTKSGSGGFFQILGLSSNVLRNRVCKCHPLAPLGRILGLFVPLREGK